MRSLSSERLQNLACPLAEATAKASGGHCNRLNFAPGALDIVIDHEKIILRVPLHLLPRPLEPALDGLFRILPAHAQPPFKLILRRRKNKNGHRVWKLSLYLLGALHIDFEHQVELFAPRLIEIPPRRPVPVLSEDASVLEKVAGLDPAVEFLFGDKIIPFSSTLRVPRGP